MPAATSSIPLPAYGAGLSETLLGKALKSVRKDVIICTKYGHSPEWVTDFSAAAIRPSVEGSLQRLQTDYVDILLVHNPPRELMNGKNSPDLYAELEQLKIEGKLREYGVSLDWAAELELMTNTTESKAAEVMYNAFYQEPGNAFQKAKENGVGLIVKVPLDLGWLAGKYNRDTAFSDVRDRWSQDVLERRAHLLDHFKSIIPPGTSLAHAALQFILAQPEVSTVIPGGKTVQQALDNFAAADQQLSSEVIQSIHNLWEHEIADDPLPW